MIRCIGRNQHFTYYNIPLYIRNKHKYHNVKPKHILKELGVRQGTIFIIQTLKYS